MAAAAAAILALLCAPVRAGHWAVAFGQTTPSKLEEFNEAVAPGPVGGVEYSVGQKLGLGLQLNSFSFRKRTTELGIGTGDGKAHVLALDVVVRVDPFYNAGFGPYAFAGGGGNRFALKQTFQPAPGWVWVDTGTSERRTVRDASSFGWTYFWGAGVQAVIASNGLLIGAEGRCDTFGISKSKFPADRVESCTFLGRVGMRFD